MKIILKTNKTKSIAFFLFCFLIVNSTTHAQDDATNVGTMYISSGTIVAAEGSFTTTAAGNTENGGDFYLKGNWTNNGTYTTNTGKVTFWGNNAQTINGTATTIYYNAEVNKSSNGVTLNTNTNVSNIVTLTNGALDLNSKTLTIQNAATTGIGYTNGFIISEDVDNSSKVQWNIGSTTGAHVIPFGTAASDFIPLTLNLTAGTIGNVTASTFPTAANNLPYPSAPDNVLLIRDIYGNDNSANTVDRFWQIDKSGATGTLTTTFTYTDAEAPSNGEAGLQAQRYGTAYNGWDAAVPFQTSNIGLNTVTAPGIITYGPYTLSQSSNPLPVELLLFSAIPDKQKNVVVSWVTASEQNSSFFTIERSKDAINFEGIENVKAAGNTTIKQYYKTLDKKPFAGISYYRLKQVDFNGNFTYSQTRKVNLDENQITTLSIFPSPAVSTVYFYLNNITESVQKFKINLFDATGKLVKVGEYYNDSNNTITLERGNLLPGMYFVKMTDESGKTLSGKILYK